MDTVSVIFCNDVPKLVILSSMGVEEEIERLAKEDFERNKWSYTPYRSTEPSYEYYRQICYWHVRDVLVK